MQDWGFSYHLHLWIASAGCRVVPASRIVRACFYFPVFLFPFSWCPALVPDGLPRLPALRARGLGSGVLGCRGVCGPGGPGPGALQGPEGLEGHRIDAGGSFLNSPGRHDRRKGPCQISPPRTHSSIPPFGTRIVKRHTGRKRVLRVDAQPRRCTLGRPSLSLRPRLPGAARGRGGGSRGKRAWARTAPSADPRRRAWRSMTCSCRRRGQSRAAPSPAARRRSSATRVARTP